MLIKRKPQILVSLAVSLNYLFSALKGEIESEVKKKREKKNNFYGVHKL